MSTESTLNVSFYKLVKLKSQRTAIWGARVLIIAAAMAFAWKTWGHWGDLQIDCGREMYVPVDVLRGKLLYRDIWYQYGPLTPYVQALAFAVFGIKLNVLYAIGMILVISAALLLFEIARSFQLVLPAAMTPALFFLAESFRPSIFNFIFPYSYAASIAAVFGFACLYAVIRHAHTGRRKWLVLAALCTCLALLTKQEFGIACFAVLTFGAVASCLNQRSWKELVKNGFVCAVGLIPAVAVYSVFIWKTSVKAIVIDNWVMTPGTYTMRTIGRYKMATEGVRFGVTEWSEAALGAAECVILWFVIAFANALVIRKLGLRRLRYLVLLVGADIFAALFVISFGNPVWAGLPAFFGQMVFPKGIFLLGCGFTMVALWKVWRTQGQAAALSEAALGIYAVMTGTRVMMEMLPSAYALFFNGAVFLVFVIIVTRVVESAIESLDVQARRRLVGCMLSAEALLLIVVLLPRHDLLNAPMRTNYGTIYTQADRAVLFPQIVSFMKTHTRNGKDIMVLPESASLYFFSGMESPTQWYEAQPGVLNPQQELALTNEADSAQVEYVLLCNRQVSEFGVSPFGIGYDRSIYRWLIANYVKISQFGPRADLLAANSDLGTYQPYVMEVYERKRERERNPTDQMVSDAFAAPTPSN